MGSKTDSKKGSLSSGYKLKNVPFWVLTIVKKHMMAQKFTPKSRKDRLLVHVLPPDFFVTNTLVKQSLNCKKGSNCVSSYRFVKSGISKRYLNLDSSALKDICRQLSIKYSKDWGGHPRLITVLIPNNVVTGKVKSISEGRCNIILAGYSKSTRGEQWDFFDDLNFSNRQYPLRISFPVYESNVIIDGILSTVFSRRKLEPEKEYNFIVYTWYEPHQGLKARKDNPVYYCFQAIEKKEKFNSLFDAGCKITNYDMLPPNWAYDKQTTALLLFNLVYVQEGEPALNAVLFGGSRVGKSRILEVFAKVFGETIHSGSKQTIKGLTGSFWGDTVNSGVMMESRFVFLGDEFFRTGLSDNKQMTYNHIITLLNEVMEMLEHTKKTASSGKFKRILFFDKSFFGTSNIRDIEMFNTAFKEDPALFNRITILNVPKQVEDRIKNLELIPPSMYFKTFEDRLLKHGINLDIYRKLFIYLRRCIPFVKVDFRKMNFYVKQTEWAHENFEKREKFYALVKCVALFNYVFSHANPFPIKRKITPTDKDYRDAVDYMNRIIRDFKQIVGLP